MFDSNKATVGAGVYVPTCKGWADVGCQCLTVCADIDLLPPCRGFTVATSATVANTSFVRNNATEFGAAAALQSCDTGSDWLRGYLEVYQCWFEGNRVVVPAGALPTPTCA